MGKKFNIRKSEGEKSYVGKLSFGNLTVNFYKKNPLVKSLMAKMSHKKRMQKVRGQKDHATKSDCSKF